MAEVKPASRLRRRFLVLVLAALGLVGLVQLASFLGRIAGSSGSGSVSATVGPEGSPTAGQPGGPNAMAGPDMGARGSVCPVTVLGQLLGAQFVAGHTPSAFGSGVGVFSVVSGGPAATAGLKGGDVILSVSGRPVDCPVTALKAIHTTVGDAAPNARAASEAILRVGRDGVLIRVVLPATVLRPAAPISTPSDDKPMVPPSKRERHSR